MGEKLMGRGGVGVAECFVAFLRRPETAVGQYHSHPLWLLVVKRRCQFQAVLRSVNAPHGSLVIDSV